MRLAELVLGAAVVLDGSGAATPPKIHEASLEAGMRVVVVSSAAAGGANAQAAAPTVAVVVALPVGYANDAGTPGSGWAAFAAGHATFELPRWSSVVVGDSMRFFASLPADGVEAGLAELAKRLVADGVEEERFNRFLEQRKVEPGSVLDRLRETAYPTTRDGGAIATATRRTRDELKTFLSDRVGSEGAVVALVGPGTPAALELAALHAFATLPRARGVAPRDPREPMPRSARRVDAPVGASGGEAGVRLPWRADERGDLMALAVAWLETRTGSDATHVVATSQGALVGFAGEAAEVTALAGALDGACAAADAIDDGQVEAAVARMVQRAEATAADPARLAAELADGAARHGDPLATFGRAARLRASAAETTVRLKELIRAAARIDVVPAAARPAGA
jgi:hypothetical protein